MKNESNDFENVGFEELRVIETEDNQRWINLDDLIISLHYQSENIDFDEENYQDIESKNLYKSTLLSIIDSLEDVHVQFSNDSDL